MMNAPIPMYTSYPAALAALPIRYLQIISPHDTGIAAAIEAQSELWKLPKDAPSSPLVTDPLRMVTQRYYYSLQQELSFRPRQENPKAAPIVYTPLHGVGLPWLQKVPCHPSLASLSPIAVLSPAACCLITFLSGSPKNISLFGFILSVSLCLFLFFSLHPFPLLHSSSHSQKVGVATLAGPPPTHPSPGPPPTHPSPHLLITLQKMDMASSQPSCCSTLVD